MIFTHDQFFELLQDFSSRIPRVVSQHHLTADLAPGLDRLLDFSETPFSLAVIGQMRGGKSSVINALTGADLAVVGVNETTATINWFKFAPEEQAKSFQVVWKDRPAQFLPLDRMTEWVGNSERAKETAWLEFYADRPFLRIANVVDTPGTRSVIQDHSEKLNEFLVRKHDSATRHLGGEADAILYVIRPVARQSDQELLKTFESATRLPNATPYNSIAVVHQWEMMSVDRPDEEVWRKIERMKPAMEALAATVLPVSAPLARAAESFAIGFFENVIQLCQRTPSSLIDGSDGIFVGSPEFIDKTDPQIGLTCSQRADLRRAYPLPWPCLKVICRVAKREEICTATELRQRVLDLSGIQRLRRELEDRFFSRSQMIKAFSLLNRALKPCQTATLRLHNHEQKLSALIEDAATGEDELARRIEAGDQALQPVRDYLRQSLATLQADLKASSEILREVGTAVTELEDAFHGMDTDLRCLDYLGKQPDAIPPEERSELARLFGSEGADVASRLDATLNNLPGIPDVLERLDHFSRQAWRGRGEAAEVYRHACDRLNEICEFLDREISRSGAKAPKDHAHA